MRSRLLLAGVLLLGSGYAAPIAAQTPYRTMTVEAGDIGTYVVLGDSATAVEVTGNPQESAAWDLAFYNTDIAINGGDAGPGGLAVTCLCANDEISDEELLLLTAATEEDNFLAVTGSDAPPPGDAWGTTAFAEHSWYRYNLAQGHRIWPTYNVYLVRKGEQVYKLQVLSYYGVADTPRQVTFRYAPL